VEAGRKFLFPTALIRLRFIAKIRLSDHPVLSIEAPPAPPFIEGQQEGFKAAEALTILAAVHSEEAQGAEDAVNYRKPAQARNEAADK
jgi:hypothetical protein